MSEMIPHHGGPRPHPPRTEVEVEFRDGRRVTATSAFVRWWHAPNDPDNDVVAYRLAPAGVETEEARAVRRLTGGDRPMLERAEFLIEAVEPGGLGRLAPDDYPGCGRIIVPATVLADLVTIARDGRIT